MWIVKITELAEASAYHSDKKERKMGSATVGVHQALSTTARAVKRPAHRRSGKKRAPYAQAGAAIPRGLGSEALSERVQATRRRPAQEWDKAQVAGSIHVPLFVEDTAMDPLTLLKKWVHFGYIGLWTGQLLTTINDQFLSQVEDAIADKDAKLLVACGEGLRSRIALKVLDKGGYNNLGWLAGGFNRSKDL
ncbi:hypothetical protein J5N97_013721 [Dioscorea zingiberensis]|uniref:Rhodanese domain-containing protein n=1 Tax=Dioscorea zingiberensis TaxID=325984 RepID=A0A9D5CSL7_9LILI|nr:hypothetical protein J5N97_013721 [Dioscorea zingiberensis]